MSVKNQSAAESRSKDTEKGDDPNRATIASSTASQEMGGDGGDDS
jgi:hypothetical protein